MTAVAGAQPAAGEKSTPRRSGAGRVVAIDGLRGIAALLVVLYHLHEAISRTASDWLWAPIDWVARQGSLGVDIFFVISGFVIALSVSKGAPTLGYFGRFVLRRSIRLDPPYWSAIALEVLLIHLTLRLFPDHAVTLPSTPQLLSHFLYLQDLLGYGGVVVSFWTLCYEIQFYAFFVGLVVLHPTLPAPLRGRAATLAGAALLFGLSLWTRYWRPDWLLHGLAIDRWFQFFIGTLTWYATAAPGRLRPLMAAWVALAMAVLLAGAPATQLLAIAVSAWLVLASRDERWGRPFASRPLQFLGAISYSVYLYHGSVGWRFVSLVQRFVPGPWSAPTAVLVYLVGIVFSVAFAALLWRFIERPCLKLCQRVRLPLRASAMAPSPAPAGAPAAAV